MTSERKFRIATHAFALATLITAGTQVAASSESLPEGYWSPGQIDPILERTLTIRLETDLSTLSPNERTAVNDLLQVGEIMHRLYLDSRHHQALHALLDLEFRHRELGGSRHTADLLDLFRLFKGPIATTLENERLPFLPVDPEVKGKNVYPLDLARDELMAYLHENPDARRELLATRTVVRRTTAKNLERDLSTLRQHPELELLHPGLEKGLIALVEGGTEKLLYAVPYSVAWADDLVLAYRFLHHAAAAMETSDPDFSAYLRLRARDLLSDDYEAGDAAWVTGSFGRLNAQIGSYETYDDELQGVKSFFSLSLLLRDAERTRSLNQAIGGLQTIENSLPYDRHKQVRTSIPVGVYNVIADFGQARGTNTASILPNESDHARKYGRTILLRYNIMTHPEIFAAAKAAWDAAVIAEHSADLTLDGRFNRTLWHEIGHYLGPSRDATGRSLDIALAENSDLIEELKSDLVSLFAAPQLRQSGYLDEAGLRGVYADGILRTLQRVKPRREQPYQTMQLMQLNYFLEQGLLAFDTAGAELRIAYEHYPEVVGSMLEKVLSIQSSGSATEAQAFIDRYASWNENLHEPLAKRLRNATRHRYRLVHYAAMD